MPGGSVIKNPLANAEGTGRSHMPQSNFYEPVLESLEATTTEHTFFNHSGSTAWSLCSATKYRCKEQPAHLSK